MIELHHATGLWWLLAVPALAIALALDGQARRRTLERIGHLPQLRRMTASVSAARRRWKAVMLVTGVGLLGVALAEPETRGAAHLEPRRGLDLVVALDFSKSMLASDVYPSRLERAKRELDRMIDGLKGDRVGLVAFAGVTLSYPLTTDYAAAKLFWRDLGPGDMPVGGTNLKGALVDALQLLDGATPKRGGARPSSQVIVLLTDGEDTEGGALDVAKEAARRGVKIYSVGIGTAAGEFVKVKRDDTGGAEYLSENGQPVRMRLDETTLQQMAAATGGDYFRVDAERSGVERVQRAIAGLERTEEEARVVHEREPAYGLLLGPALALLLVEALLGDRRRARRIPAGPASEQGARGGGIAPAALALVLCLPALTGFDLFERPNPDVEQGNRLLAGGKSEEALAAYDRALAAHPDDPVIHYDRGAALFKLGKLPEAQREFQRAAAETGDASLKADALYNMGNALYRQERAKEALEAYKRSLGVRPEDRHAKWNLEMALRKLREEQEKKQQQQQQQQQPPTEPKDPKDPQEQKGQEQKGQEQKGQEQKGQEQKGQEQKGQEQKGQEQKGQEQKGQEQKGQEQKGQEQKGQEQKGQEQKGQEQKGQEQKGQEQKGQEQKGQEQKGQEQKTASGEPAEKAKDQDQKAKQAIAGRAARDIDKQDAEAVLDAFERVEPTVQKDLAKRKAGNRRARRDW